ncbi:uncharacterized protein M421DRAFT_417124 [Didymella exigua CBS 183.55]|uniref:Uncharacterized protein n=1 Tax=Didymella exigua CBS 183.55 TaxID=1150837 RepID=A0A6A5RYI1_9PLEO|nr:uncharacterized protein M421DRAFT_417124 [Didymella exigua CBS 183.55]KAF1932410.1 hypothetical protein M421DRAFT_417124 [Didymella exigua CBS 183.55]
MTTGFTAFFARLRVENSKASYPDAECSTLTSYLNGDIDVQQCATELTEYTDRRLPVSSKLVIWGLIIQLGLNFAETHEDLVALSKEVLCIPASKATGGIDWTNETQSLGQAFRSFYDSTRGPTLDADNAGAQKPTTGQSTASRQWSNINEFGARLQHAGLLDDSLNGLLLIVKLLEMKPSEAQVQMNLGAAAAWLEFASKEIREGAAGVGAHTNWAQSSDYKKEPQVDGKRLVLWKERLAELSGLPYVSEELAVSCERATTAIEQALWERKN